MNANCCAPDGRNTPSHQRQGWRTPSQERFNNPGGESYRHQFVEDYSKRTRGIGALLDTGYRLLPRARRIYNMSTHVLLSVWCRDDATQIPSAITPYSVRYIQRGIRVAQSCTARTLNSRAVAIPLQNGPAHRYGGRYSGG